MSERMLSGSRNNLATRRRRRRRRVAFASSVVFLFLFITVLYGLWQAPVRIARIDINHPEYANLAVIAKEMMTGNYLGIIPRDSIFFFPEKKIRMRVLSEYPELAAISITRNGFSGIAINTNERVPIARWCGSAHPNATVMPAASSTISTAETECYLFDASGFIFATSSSRVPANQFKVYENMDIANPIGSMLPKADAFPSIFDFARQMRSLGSPTVSVVLREEEVDDYLTSGTRITYILGDEQNAFAALVSAQNNITIADGSIEYVDLRFSGKVYVKRISR